MKLREYIDKSLEQETPKALIIRSIDLSRTVEDLQKSIALMSSLSQDMDNDDLIFVKQYLDKAWVKFQGQSGRVL